jgi:hypothetical protein
LRLRHSISRHPRYTQES